MITSDPLTLSQAEERGIRIWGRMIGFGRMMQLGQQLWRRELASQGIAGGEFAIGPCVALTVPCPHPSKDLNGHCDWCCGCGWLTEHVLEASKKLLAEGA